MRESVLLIKKLKVGKIYYQILKKMVNELSERKNKFNDQLEKLDNQPKYKLKKRDKFQKT